MRTAHVTPHELDRVSATAVVAPRQPVVPSRVMCTLWGVIVTLIPVIAWDTWRTYTREGC